MVQAAGRAGRGRYRGEVIIQTYNPEHYVIRSVEKGNYKEFYTKELRYRKVAEYPPETHLLGIILLSVKAEEVNKCGEILHKFISENNENNFYLSMPVWAGIPKIRDVYRKIIYLKSNNRDELVRAKNVVEKYVKDCKEFGKTGVQFDFEPYGNL